MTGHRAINRSNKQQLASIESTTRDQFAAQGSALAKLDGAVCENSKRISESNALTTSVLQGLQWAGQLATQFKATISQMMLINIATYKAVLSLQTSLPSRLERTLIDQPFILEDAIGRISPVHLQFINSWSALEAVLETRFHGIPGHEEVQSGQYVLQEDRTGFEISRQRAWDGAFLPGQKVNMSMVFRRLAVRDTTSAVSNCPFCRCDSTKSTDSEVEWSVFELPCDPRLTTDRRQCQLRTLVPKDHRDP